MPEKTQLFRAEQSQLHVLHITTNLASDKHFDAPQNTFSNAQYFVRNGLFP
jgi:hypothetical protein